MRSYLGFLLAHMLEIENLESLEIHFQKLLVAAHSGKPQRYSGGFPSNLLKLFASKSIFIPGLRMLGVLLLLIFPKPGT